MSSRVYRKVLEWFGHVERMSVDRLTNRVYKSEVEGSWIRGRPCTRCRDIIKKAYNTSSMELSDAKIMMT